MSCDIETIKNTGKFTWGQPIQWHYLGPYTILAFHPRKVDGFTVTKEIDEEQVSYHGWLEGRDEHTSWPSLETAIIGLIGRKYAGLNNGGVEYYFCRGIQAPPYNEG